MAQSGTELFIATGGTKMQFMINKEQQLKCISDELTTQGKVIVNIIEGEIKRPLTGWWQEIRIIWKTADVQPTYTITAPPPQPQTQPQTQPIIEKVSVTSDNFNSILDRIDLFLEDKEWDKAIAYCESALDFDPKNANIYLKYLLADCKCSTFEEVLNSNQSFENNAYYQKTLRFGDEKLVKTLKSYIEKINFRNKQAQLNEVYNTAKRRMNNATFAEEFQATAEMFKRISDYRDSSALAEECIVKANDFILLRAKNTVKNETSANYAAAIKLLKEIPDWKDSQELIALYEKRYTIVKKQEDEKLAESREKERQERIEREKREEQARIEREKREEQARIEKEKKKKKRKIIAISIPSVIALITAIALLFVTVIIPKAKFKNIVAISAGGAHTVGLKSDGTVVAVGWLFDGRCNTSTWAEVVTISAGNSYTVGLKSDGTVVATGENYNGQRNVNGWTDIVEVSASSHTVGLKSNGTVVAVGLNADGQCDVDDWMDIVAISAGDYHTVGLKSDGTVVAVGWNRYGECDTNEWNDIVAISAGYSHTIGLKSDGTVVAVGLNEDGQCDVDDWMDIVAISAGDYHTVGLKSDGTVVAVGLNEDGQCDISDWTDIISVAACGSHTVGLKLDGTVAAVGFNGYGQCLVGGKK